MFDAYLHIQALLTDVAKKGFLLYSLRNIWGHSQPVYLHKKAFGVRFLLSSQ